MPRYVITTVNYTWSHVKEGSAAFFLFRFGERCSPGLPPAAIQDEERYRAKTPTEAASSALEMAPACTSAECILVRVRARTGQNAKRWVIFQGETEGVAFDTRGKSGSGCFSPRSVGP